MVDVVVRMHRCFGAKYRSRRRSALLGVDGSAPITAAPKGLDALSEQTFPVSVSGDRDGWEANTRP